MLHCNPAELPFGQLYTLFCEIFIVQCTTNQQRYVPDWHIAIMRPLRVYFDHFVTVCNRRD
jgi:hypothetical protein